MCIPSLNRYDIFDNELVKITADYVYEYNYQSMAAPNNSRNKPWRQNEYKSNMATIRARLGLRAESRALVSFLICRARAEYHFYLMSFPYHVLHTHGVNVKVQ